MKFCIIGSEKRSKTDMEILRKAKKLFSAVLYVPQTSLMLKNGKSVYKKADLDSFDAVLPRIKRSMGLMAYSVIRNTRAYCPISPEAYLFCSDRFLMMEHLKSSQVKTIDIYAIRSPSLAHRITEKISFPLCIRIPSKEKGMMFVDNHKELRPLLDMLGTSNEPIYIEEFPGNVYYQAFVIGSHVYALRRRAEKRSDIYLGKGIPEKCFLTDELKTLAREAAETLGTKFCRVDICDQGILNISLSPPMVGMRDANSDLIEKLLEHIRHMAK